MKAVFAGTPEFAAVALQALIPAHQVMAVFTQPDRAAGRGKKLTPPPVKVVAQEHGLPVHQPASLRDQADIIGELKPDVMVVVAYGMILPQEILDIPVYGCINIHASLLPRWRGAAPIQRAIEAGDRRTGVSIMRMDAGLDTGPVYQTLSTEIGTQDTSADLHNRLANLGAEGILSTLADIQHQQPVAQDESAATYANKINTREAAIDWTESAVDIQRRIRAFIPWPVCRTTHAGTRIRLWSSSCRQAADQVTANRAVPGEIIEIDESGIAVACGSGVLQIERLQRDGSKSMPSSQFCNGYPLQVGQRFE